MRYAELHCLSNFSFLRGASHPEELVEQAAALGYSALAITDRNSLAGVVRAHVAVKRQREKSDGATERRSDEGKARGFASQEAARSISSSQVVRESSVSGSSSLRRSVAPSLLRLIIGAEITPVDAPPIVLLAPDRPAYGRLCRLITRGRLRCKKGDCHITLADVAEFAEGLIGIVLPEERHKGTEARRYEGQHRRPAGANQGFERSRDQEIERSRSTSSEREAPASAAMKEDRRSANGEGGNPKSKIQNPKSPRLSASPNEVPDWSPSCLRASVPSWLLQYRSVFGSRLHLAVELRFDLPDDVRLRRLAAWSEAAGVPLVACNDVHYHVPERRYLQDVLTCIREKCTLATAGRRLFANAERHLRPLEEIGRRYTRFVDPALSRIGRDALVRTLEIADRCTFTLDELRYDYPSELAPEGMSAVEYLERLTWEGAYETYEISHEATKPRSHEGEYSNPPTGSTNIQFSTQRRQPHVNRTGDQNVPRSDCMAKGKRASQASLSGDRTDARFREIRLDHADAASGGLHTVQYRRRARTPKPAGLHPLSKNCTRLSDGASDSAHPVRGTRLLSSSNLVERLVGRNGSRPTGPHSEFGKAAKMSPSWLRGFVASWLPPETLQLLDAELALIRDLRYEHYFLTVHDLVRFARSKGILCQGRGSAANSAVCYCLGITAVDPTRHDLLFERFISRERNEPPDIDVDFEHERREEVFQYIYEKYGRERAAITAEVITYRPRSAVRDVGKALGLSLDQVDAIAKGIDWFDAWEGEERDEETERRRDEVPADEAPHREARSRNRGVERSRDREIKRSRGAASEREAPASDASESALSPGHPQSEREAQASAAMRDSISPASPVAAGAPAGRGSRGNGAAANPKSKIQNPKSADNSMPRSPIPDPRSHSRNVVARCLRNAGVDPYDRTIRMLISLVRQLLGFPRHLSQHVGGFVITESPLCEIVPLENGAMPGRTFIEWDKDDIDALGILKVDCLALGMLTAISKAFGLLRAEGSGIGDRGSGISGPHLNHVTVDSATNQGGNDVERRIISRAESVAGVDRAGQADLQSHAEDAGVGALRIDQSDPTGRRLDSQQHRRGQRPSDPARLRALSNHCSRVARRDGNAVDHRPGTGNAARREGRVETHRRSHPNAPGSDQSPEWLSPLSTTLDKPVSVCIPGPASSPDPRSPIPDPSLPHRLIPRTLRDIPSEDPAVYDMICRADTIGVFQIESRAQMSMLPRLKPRCFYDLVIEVAIVRPGPIQGGMIHPYLRRRDNLEKVTFPSDDVRRVLAKTLGVPIFQEQVMRLAVVAAGFTPGEADQLRRSMAAWRRNGAIERFQVRLMQGMLERGYSRQFAEQIYMQIRGFGEYGFPESHSASFALLVYASAWLKRYHPAAFAAAIINSQPMGFYAPAQLVRDAIEHGVEVRGVDVNFSGWDCSLEERHEGTEARRHEGGVQSSALHERDEAMERRSDEGEHRRPAGANEEGSGIGDRGSGSRDEETERRRDEVSADVAPPRKERSGDREIKRSRSGTSEREAQASAVPESAISPATAPSEREAQASGASKDALTAGPVVAGAPACHRAPETPPSEWGAAGPAMRLGFRLVRGLSEEKVRGIVAARCEQEPAPRSPIPDPRRITSIRQLARRPDISRETLLRLAAADAFRSLGLNRREALWQILLLDSDETTLGWRSRPEGRGSEGGAQRRRPSSRRGDRTLPLFAELEPEEPPVKLPEMTPSETVVQDYNTTGLSLNAHPIELVRAELDLLGMKRSRDREIKRSREGAGEHNPKSQIQNPKLEGRGSGIRDRGPGGAGFQPAGRSGESPNPKSKIQNPKSLLSQPILRNVELKSIRSGRRAAVSGLVLVRQRPGTAKGIIFMTIEDETGVANLVVRPHVWERFRSVARASPALIAEGVVEKQGEVIHLMVNRLHDLAACVAAVRSQTATCDAIRSIGSRSRDFH